MSTAFVYVSRIIPALSVIAVVTLLVFSYIVAPYGKTARGQHHGEATRSQLILSVYAIVLHIFSIIFSARVCWAMGDVIRKVKETASIPRRPKRRKNQVVKDGKGRTTYPLPVFVIIIPAYKEEIETLEQTIRVLGSHPDARSSYHVRRI